MKAQAYSSRLSFTNTVAALLVFLYWLVYENVIFFYAEEYGGTPLLILTNAVKLLLPFALLAYTGLPPFRLLLRGYVSLYVLFFAAFLTWGLVPTLLSGELMSWAKLLPRFVFFLGVVAFFSKRPAAFSLVAKCIVLYVISALVQYVLLYVTRGYDNTLTYENQIMAGPFGILGNVTSMMNFPGAPFPFIRLTGFWNEPSNASGSAFAAFYLARYLVATGASGFWRKASYACLAAGLLALSNAGYFAFGATLVFGFVFRPGKASLLRIAQFAVMLPIVVALAGIVIFGRSYVAEHLSDNIWARAITGVRELDEQAGDASGGRVEGAKMTFEQAGLDLIGVGIQEVGSDGIEGSGTAPLYWLLLTGIPGLLLLLCREAAVLAAMRSLSGQQPHLMPLAQALIAVMAQHFIYGSWMNSNYFIMAAMVLVCAQRAAQQSGIANRPLSYE